MNHPRLLPVVAVFVLVASVIAGSPAAANTLSEASPVAPAGAPRSSFVNVHGENGFGKDPFFPKTVRFTRQVQKDEVPIVVPDFPAGLVLKGISLVAGRKLAIINYQTVAEQEEFSIRLDGKPVKGLCVEIKDKSVVLKVNGVTKEIPLRPGLQ